MISNGLIIYVSLNLSNIKEMLGHSDISTTQVYAKLIKNKYASDYKKFHPLAR